LFRVATDNGNENINRGTNLQVKPICVAEVDDPNVYRIMIHNLQTQDVQYSNTSNLILELPVAILSPMQELENQQSPLLREIQTFHSPMLIEEEIMSNGAIIETNSHNYPTPSQIERLRIKLNFGVDNNLSVEQYKALWIIYQSILNQENRQNNTPIRLLILGGPGTGKTYTMSQATKLTNRPFTFTAANGSAASNLRSGRTICNALGFCPKDKKKDPASKKHLPALTNDGVDSIKKLFLLEQFQQKHGFLCIDEVSTIHALYLKHIDNRMREVPYLGTSFGAHANETPFGGNDVIMMGDWNQIAAIGNSIPDSIYRILILKDPMTKPGDSIIVESIDLFKTFRRTVLKTQNRSKDSDHTARINRLASLDLKHPIDQSFVNYLYSIQLTVDDTASVHSPWILKAVCLTPSNV
jgi:hypothetical protein